MIFEGTKKLIFFGLGLTRAGTGMPDISMVVSLAKTLNVSTDYLFGLEKMKLMTMFM